LDSVRAALTSRVTYGDLPHHAEWGVWQTHQMGAMAASGTFLCKRSSLPPALATAISC
jgi:hypothetical protein